MGLLRTAARRLLARFGVRIVRDGSQPAAGAPIDGGGVDGWTPLEAALHGLLSAKGTLTVVQVGANDGKWNDPIHAFLMQERASTRVLLVEPQPEIAAILSGTYRGHGGATILQGAIAVEAGELVLYRVRPSIWDATAMPYLEEAPRYRAPSGFASTDRSHVERHIRHLRWRSTGGAVPVAEALEELRVEARTFSDLRAEYPDAFPIDVLQVDVEGIDDDLVVSALDSGIFPNLINFEALHLTTGRMADVRSRLESCGYRCTITGPDLLAIRTAGGLG